MLRIIFPVILLMAASTVTASTQYISDELRVPLRKSPCGSCAILHRGLRAGLRLNVLETEDGWSHVTTPGGLDGWLESQYLVKKPIARTLLAGALKDQETLKNDNTALRNSLNQAQQTLEQLRSELATVQETNRIAVSELAEIREVSADALNLYTQNAELLKQNKMLQSEIDLLTATTEQLSRNNSQKWFFYGALAVVMGALLAVLLPRLKRRRRGYSEWA